MGTGFNWNSSATLFSTAFSRFSFFREDLWYISNTSSALLTFGAINLILLPISALQYYPCIFRMSKLISFYQSCYIKNVRIYLCGDASAFGVKFFVFIDLYTGKTTDKIGFILCCLILPYSDSGCRYS